MIVSGDAVRRVLDSVVRLARIVFILDFFASSNSAIGAPGYTENRSGKKWSICSGLVFLNVVRVGLSL